jgi:hypothetical protein
MWQFLPLCSYVYPPIYVRATYFTSYVNRPRSSNPSRTSCYSTRRTMTSATKFFSTQFNSSQIIRGGWLQTWRLGFHSRPLSSLSRPETFCGPFSFLPNALYPGKERFHFSQSPSSVMFVAWNSCPQYPFMVLSVVIENSIHIFMKYILQTYLNNIILCAVSKYKIKLATDYWTRTLLCWSPIALNDFRAIRNTR